MKSTPSPFKILSFFSLVVSSIVFIPSCAELTKLTSKPSAGDSNTPIPAIPKSVASSKTANSLQPGDNLKITFPNAEELNISQKVRMDGKLSLPMIGEIAASGKSISSLQSSLKSRYSKHLQDPNVVVTMESTASTVYVSGKVNEPIKIVLERQMTALEAIMEAGGFNEYGSAKKVVVVRNENGQHKRYNLNLEQALYADGSNAFYLRPFDVIFAY